MEQTAYTYAQLAALLSICMIFLCGCQTINLEKSDADSESATVNLIIWEW